jgi:hypothetical protein
MIEINIPHREMHDLKYKGKSQALVAHTCNPNYCRNQED